MSTVCLFLPEHLARRSFVHCSEPGHPHFRLRTWNRGAATAELRVSSSIDVDGSHTRELAFIAYALVAHFANPGERSRAKLTAPAPRIELSRPALAWKAGRRCRSLRA